jgi:flagellar FliL protein
MAENPEEAVVETGSPPKRAGKILPVLLAVVASGVGGTLGMTLLSAPAGAWMAERASEGGGKKSSGGHGGGHGGGGAETIHTLDNLVVNPAGSEGTRYLLVSVALEPVDPDMVEELALVDVALRHALLSFLGSKTVQELADITARDALVEEMKTALEHEVGEGMIHRIYLPQYVIQ